MYHQRSPTPNSGSVCQMSIDCLNQSMRWKKELYSLPLAIWPCTRDATMPRAGSAASRMILERRSLLDPWLRRVMTTRATASPTRAWRDCAARIPAMAIQKFTWAKSVGQRTHGGRA